jgi:signal peptidase II
MTAAFGLRSCDFNCMSADPASLPSAPAADGPSPSVFERLLVYRLLLLLATATLALDQATKFWIAGHVSYDPSHSHDLGQDLEIIPGFFYLIHVGNTGAAWSMLAGQGVLLASLAALTLAAIFFWRHAFGLRDRPTQYAFGLLCGGIAGNLLDRLARGHVTDFLDFHFGSYIYPTFNVADSGICVGTIIYVIRSLSRPDGARRQ